MDKGLLHICDLVEKAQKGDRQAFQEIYNLYYDRLYRYGCSTFTDEGLVHDTIQDVFVWLMQHPHKLARIDNLDTYLFKCVRRNLSSSSQRAKSKKNSAKRYYQGQQEEMSVEERFIESERLNTQSTWLSYQLDQLSPHQKEVIYLRFYENLSYDQMADIFAVSNQVVRNSVYRALKSLRQNAAQVKNQPLKRSHFLLSLFL